MQPIRMYLGTPQTSKLQVFNIPAKRRAVMKEIVLTNTENEDVKITLTINTVDVIKDYIVPASKTEFIHLSSVLNQNDAVYLQQDKLNAVNVMISGELE